MMFAEAAPTKTHWPAGRPDVVKIGKDASIGMLYSAITPCGEFVPGDWMRPVVFKQVPTPA
jgi:hypothetical protein